MGKGAGIDKKAAKAQEQAMADSKAHNAKMLELMQAQIDNAKTMKLPKPPAPMPLPNSGAADMVAQSQEMAKSLRDRHGLQSTKVAPTTPPLRSAYGIPMFNTPSIAA